jgi:Domain of unknown function (DUF4386)
MYRSGLVPRGLAMLGLVAGPVLLAGGTAALLGVIEPDSALKLLVAVPEFVWELSLGIYLMVKGFRPSPSPPGWPPPHPPTTRSTPDRRPPGRALRGPGRVRARDQLERRPLSRPRCGMVAVGPTREAM